MVNVKIDQKAAIAAGHNYGPAAAVEIILPYLEDEQRALLAGRLKGSDLDILVPEPTMSAVVAALDQLLATEIEKQREAEEREARRHAEIEAVLTTTEFRTAAHSLRAGRCAGGSIEFERCDRKFNWSPYVPVEVSIVPSLPRSVSVSDLTEEQRQRYQALKTSVTSLNEAAYAAAEPRAIIALEEKERKDATEMAEARSTAERFEIRNAEIAAAVNPYPDRLHVCDVMDANEAACRIRWMRKAVLDGGIEADTIDPKENQDPNQFPRRAKGDSWSVEGGWVTGGCFADGYMASVSPDPKSPGGWDRDFWARGRGGDKIFEIPADVELGDLIEEATAKDRKGRRDREFHVVIGIRSDTIYTVQAAAVAVRSVVKFRDAVQGLLESYIAPVEAAPDYAALKSERDSLAARIVEIDTVLATEAVS